MFIGFAVVVDGNAESSPVPSSVPKFDSKHWAWTAATNATAEKREARVRFMIRLRG
jgi:hypothetical protein